MWKLNLAQLLVYTRLNLPVVQTLDSAIHRISHYPEDKYYDNQLIVTYPVDNAIHFSNNWGQITITDFNYTIPWIVIYPVDSAIQRLNNQHLRI